MTVTFMPDMSPRKIFIVEERKNPSTDCFVIPEVAGSGGGEVIRCDFRQLPSSKELDAATVIFVRYIPPSWVKLVDEVQTAKTTTPITRIALFPITLPP